MGWAGLGCAVLCCAGVRWRLVWLRLGVDFTGDARALVLEGWAGNAACNTMERCLVLGILRGDLRVSEPMLLEGLVGANDEPEVRSG